MNENIIIKGAKENNLKNIDLTLPRNKLIVFTGVSGSGKSTLAFDTIFAEGQRRFVESLSAYARQFLGQVQKPDVDRIDGLSPSISIEQKTTSNNPRSTVGTVTEIYDYLRLLYANVGIPHCPKCGKKISKQTVDEIVDRVLTLPEGEKITVNAPVVRAQKGSHEALFERYKKQGYVRVLVDGEIYLLEEQIKLNKNKKHDISIVIDRLKVKPEIQKRLSESVEKSLEIAEGLVLISTKDEDKLYSNNYACKSCGFSFAEITPRLFSFNNPQGACPVCSGIGYKNEIDKDLVITDWNLSLNQNAIDVSGWRMKNNSISGNYFKGLSKKYGFSLDTPLKDLPEDIIDLLLYGMPEGEKMKIRFDSKSGSRTFNVKYEGVINNLQRRYREGNSDFMKAEIEKYMRVSPCHNCNGQRLKKEALAIKINNKNISEIADMDIDELFEFIDNLTLTKSHAIIAEHIVKEIKARLGFLKDVGLNYLTLSRNAGSLSGGEAQRIRLATQIGSGLMGVLYILDEPSIGLHQRDNERLLKTLKRLKDLGNTLIVVEHDEDTMREADYIVDIGPMAGVHGGEVVAEGDIKQIKKQPRSLTGQYLSGKRKIEIPEKRRKADRGYIEIVGAKQNNLKNISVKFPIGVLTAITGVSGSGKSSLVTEILYPALANNLNRAKVVEGKYKEIKNLDLLDKVIDIDQSPIGRTPRSNPATYTSVFTHIRELFASTKEAKAKGYAMGRFSFNVAGGRCEACNGDGIKKIEMYFLPDVYVPCEICKGKRYNRETLDIKYKGKNIYEVLEMTVEEASIFFANIPKINKHLKTLMDVGLGYIKLGQPATTLSGGEAQRVKLASELSKRSTGKTVYILDEPTTGLHMYDVDRLITILQRLVSAGNTVIVIEHNLDVIKVADYIIDIGPEGGIGGGKIIAKGTPEQITKVEKSHTGRFLKPILNNK